MDIVVKPLAELTAKEYRACWSLNFRSEGYMMGDIKRFRDRSDAYAIMIWENDLLSGWALLVPSKLPELYLNEYARRMTKFAAQFYVRHNKRGKGLGRRLMAETLKMDPRPYVYPYDTTSGAFFADYTVTCKGRYRKYINEAKKEKGRYT